MPDALFIYRLTYKPLDYEISVFIAFVIIPHSFLEFY